LSCKKAIRYIGIARIHVAEVLTGFSLLQRIFTEYRYVNRISFGFLPAVDFTSRKEPEVQAAVSPSPLFILFTPCQYLES